MSTTHRNTDRGQRDARQLRTMLRDSVDRCLSVRRPGRAADIWVRFDPLSESFVVVKRVGATIHDATHRGPGWVDNELTAGTVEWHDRKAFGAVRNPDDRPAGTEVNAE